MTPIDPAGTAPSVATIRAAVVRSPFGPFGNGMGEDQTYRYLLPAGAEPGPLVLRKPAGQRESNVEFWTGTEWTEVDVDEAEVDVPPTAVRDGVVLVRLPFSEMAGDPSSDPRPRRQGAVVTALPDELPGEIDIEVVDTTPAPSPFVVETTGLTKRYGALDRRRRDGPRRADRARSSG